MVHLNANEVRQLLHNKFVVVMGDSVQRAVYKDLVLLLQKDCLLSTSQLKAKGEMSFEHDVLLEGGRLGPMHNGTHYREVRQFCSAHHLVRFYFLTRAYSPYVEKVLAQLLWAEHRPDVVVMNSCLWDVSRYGRDSMGSYRKNVERLFWRLHRVLPESCLLVWNTAMPVAKTVSGAFLPPEHRLRRARLRADVVEANFYSASEARRHGFGVLDLHFHFRHSSPDRQPDGIHWNARAHRKLTQLLLAHLADAWGGDVPRGNPVGRWMWEGPASGLRGPARDASRLEDGGGESAEEPRASRPPRPACPSAQSWRPPVPLPRDRRCFPRCPQGAGSRPDQSRRRQRCSGDPSELRARYGLEANLMGGLQRRRGRIHTAFEQHRHHVLHRASPPYPPGPPERPRRRWRRGREPRQGRAHGPGTQ
ncbi:PC-esterase domain-containing protein 1B-like [Trichechus inunguis]